MVEYRQGESNRNFRRESQLEPPENWNQDRQGLALFYWLINSQIDLMKNACVA